MRLIAILPPGKEKVIGKYQLHKYRIVPKEAQAIGLPDRVGAANAGDEIQIICDFSMLPAQTGKRAVRALERIEKAVSLGFGLVALRCPCRFIRERARLLVQPRTGHTQLVEAQSLLVPQPLPTAEGTQTLVQSRPGMNGAHGFHPQTPGQPLPGQPEETHHLPVQFHLPQTGLPALEKQVPSKSNVRFRILGQCVKREPSEQRVPGFDPPVKQIGRALRLPERQRDVAVARKVDQVGPAVVIAILFVRRDR